MGRHAVLATAVVAALSVGCGSRAPVPHAAPSPTFMAPSPATDSPAPRASSAPSSAPRVHAHAAVGPVLLRYGSCSDLLARIKHEALKEVTAWGLVTVGPIAYAGDAVGTPLAMATTTGSASASAGAAPVASTTNNQEAGVDEPDLAKTDGDRMVVLRHQPLGVQVIDVRTERPRLRGFLRLRQLGWDAQLLLAGRFVVAVGAEPSTQDWPYQQNAQSGVVVIDLADLDHPQVVRSFTVDGSVVSSRFVGGRVLLVLQDGPRVVMTTPLDDTAGARSRALKENRRRIRVSSLDRWLPTVTAHPSGREVRSACGSTYHSTSESGVATTSVLAIDPAQDAPGRLVSVVGNAGVVYASTTSLYVAMTSWQAQWAMSRGAPSAERTQLHGFDISGTGTPTYLGSGSVPGSLTSQYALSEHKGYLRVATTEGQTTPPPNEGTPPAKPSDNLVTVLKPRDGSLVRVGQVCGLGRGERIYGVRFVDDIGYVVTFRQTDPLYVLDLHDPTRPAVRGELKVTGYSAYLHPIGGGMLVGLGQGVDAQLRQTGTQASVFDVADVSRPTMRSRLSLGPSSSTAEQDPHAFLWWGPARLVVVPLDEYGEGHNFHGVVALHVDGAGRLRVVGRVQHPVSDQPQNGSEPMPVDCCTAIARSLVVGELLYTVSEHGVMASALTGFGTRAWLPYT